MITLSIFRIMHDGFDLHTFFWQCFNSINSNPTANIDKIVLTKFFQ